MDFSSPDYWFTILQIILIDILLGGDNAVVIALACRRLPEHQRNKGIFWGVFGAIGLRAIFLIFAVSLLALPYVKIIGGLLLFWIAVNMATPEGGEEGEIDGGTTLMGAIRTVVVADAVMSIDNVVAVAAAARDDWTQAVLGVVISIPIIVWGSKIVLKLMERFPVIVLLGAALLGWIAGGLLVSDIAIKPWVPEMPSWLHYIASGIGAMAVVAAGRMLAHRSATAKTSNAS